jgi:hypothetical protein
MFVSRIARAKRRKGTACTDLSSFGANFVLQLDGIREMFLIPIKVPVLFRILDIQPCDIQRDILLIEPTLHLENIRIINIIPSTLVITQRPLGWEISRTRESCVLLEKRSRIGSRQYEEIHDSGFRHPMCLDAALCVYDVDERFRCDEG